MDKQDNQSYDVGYKKPPVKTRFKKGKSGNPSGRPKGSKNKKPFYPMQGGNLHEFQKQVVDAGYEDIQVIKDGKPVSMSKIDAVLAQLYNQAMKGHIGASKILLEWTLKSMESLQMASNKLHSTTMAMRANERRKIFTPPPSPDTYGDFLEKKHKIYSARFALREVFGEDAAPYLCEEEPRYETDWHIFNFEMKQDYKLIGDRPFIRNNPEIPSLLLL